jgi:hypothetical protein
MQGSPIGSLWRAFVIKVHIGHRGPIQRDAIEYACIDDCALSLGSVGDGRDEHTAFTANQEIRGPMRKTIVPNLGGIPDVDCKFARRVRCAHHAMAPTKRTAVVPQLPVHRIDVGAIDDSESAAMTSALIFPHRAFLAIDRTLAHWGSPDATAAETLGVTRRSPLSVGYLLPPTCVAPSCATMSISTHAPIQALPSAGQSPASAVRLPVPNAASALFNLPPAPNFH